MSGRRRTSRYRREVEEEEEAAAAAAAAEVPAPAPAPAQPVGLAAAGGGGGGVPPGGLAAAVIGAELPLQTVRQIMQTYGISETTFRYLSNPVIEKAAKEGDAVAQAYLTISYNFQRALYDCLRQLLIYQNMYDIEGGISATSGRNVFRAPQAAEATKGASCNYIRSYFILTYLAHQKLATYKALSESLKTTTSVPRQSSGMATVGMFTLTEITRLTDREIVGFNAIAQLVYGDEDYNDCTAAIKAAMPSIPSGGWPALTATAADLFARLNTESRGRYTLSTPPDSEKTVQEWLRAAAAKAPAAASRLAASVASPLAAAAGFAGQTARTFLSGETAYTQSRNTLPGGVSTVYPVGAAMNYVYVNDKEVSKSALVARARAAVEYYKETGGFREKSEVEQKKLLAFLQKFIELYNDSPSPNAQMVPTVNKMIEKLSQLPAGAGGYGRNQGGGRRRRTRRSRRRKTRTRKNK